MGRGRKPNMGKHTQAIFYLPEELLTKLKLRRIQTGESASKFVARLLRAELIQETKQEDYHNFFKFGGLLKAKFYNQGMSMPMKEDYDWYSKMLLNAEVLTLDPEEWEDKERRQWIKLFTIGSDILLGKNYHLVFDCKHLDQKRFMEFYNVQWKVEE